MQIQKISNNSSFNGLYLGDINKRHMKEYIKPNKKDLKMLGERADIYIETDFLPVFPLRLPVLTFTVKPVGSKNPDETISKCFLGDDDKLTCRFPFAIYQTIEEMKAKLTE